MMATISRDFEVHLEADRIVRVSVDEPCGVEIESPTVVFIPGFKGFKDWGGLAMVLWTSRRCRAPSGSHQPIDVWSWRRSRCV